MNQQNNQPIKKFRVGGITASVWRNEETQPDGNILVKHSVQIQKRYRDKEGNWQDSNSYFANDLPKLQLVVAKAYEFATLIESEANVEQSTASE